MTARPSKDLLIDPSDAVEFYGPFDKPQTVKMTLTNQENKRVAFKVKCTDNKRFKIAPAVAFLGPLKTVTVQLTCSAFEYDDNEAAKRHRFSISHVYAKPNVKRAREAFSAAAEEAAGQELERRASIQVVFVPLLDEEDYKDEDSDEEESDEDGDEQSGTAASKLDETQTEDRASKQKHR